MLEQNRSQSPKAEEAPGLPRETPARTAKWPQGFPNRNPRWRSLGTRTAWVLSATLISLSIGQRTGPLTGPSNRQWWLRWVA